MYFHIVETILDRFLALLGLISVPPIFSFPVKLVYHIPRMALHLGYQYQPLVHGTQRNQCHKKKERKKIWSPEAKAFGQIDHWTSGPHILGGP